MTNKKDIRLLKWTELQDTMLAMGEKKFRARQVWEWLWQKGVGSFDEMTNLSKKLREVLQDQFEIRKIQLDKSQISSDGTIKNRYRLYDGHLIEAVLIPVPAEDRYTVCVSSQVGCSLTCTFCATGKMKRVRNLDPGEIYDQYQSINQLCIAQYDRPLTNIVFMGMGEPLLAYSNVLQGIELLTSPDGLDIGSRRVTVSTAGIAKMIERLADDNVKFNLALSLHAADDIKRNKIMPINEQNNLSRLMQALKYFYQKTKNKISYEYIAFQGFNDSLEDADKLAKLCQDFPVKINIIEYNRVDGVPFHKSSANQLDAFARRLREHQVTVTVRRSRGKDIDAACGQLANKG